MSKSKKVGKVTKPKSEVKVLDKVLSDMVYVDFTKYPDWTNTVKMKGFTNCLKDQNEALRHFFFILDQVIPNIEKQGKDLFNNQAKHCHRLSGPPEELAKKVIREIHGQQILDDQTSIWELSGEIEEIRIVGSFVNDGMHIFYPLFIDHHHLIYPSEKYNSPDYSNYGFTKEKIRSAN